MGMLENLGKYGEITKQAAEAVVVDYLRRADEKARPWSLLSAEQPSAGSLQPSWPTALVRREPKRRRSN